MSFDFFPTFRELSGAEKPDRLTLDAVDLSPLLLNGEPLPERTLFWRYRGHKAARRGPWKLTITEKDTLLFNLEEDWGEQNDLSDRYPERLNVLISELDRWQRDVLTGVQLKTD